MVFFHGGGWMCGSGIKSFYGPDYLLDHDIIYIGANFRLGPLGFLSTGQEDCSGNWGLKDQNMVLRWIKENIINFNGNPDLVTIFGESAGGASVTYHMMSPLSKGLFHRGISQSGTFLDPWAAVAHPGVAEKRSIQMGEKMGCQINNSNFAEMIECLRKVPAKNVTEAFYDYFVSFCRFLWLISLLICRFIFQKWDTDPMIPFPPVIEKPTVEGAFITEEPRYKQDPHALEVPWMTGITSEEGAMKSARKIFPEFICSSILEIFFKLIYSAIINLPEVTIDILKNWETALPISLYYDHLDEAKQEEITKEINKFYFGDQKLTESTRGNLTNVSRSCFFSFNCFQKLMILPFIFSSTQTPGSSLV